MEITQDALLRAIKGARLAARLAEDTKALMLDRNGWTVADEVAGFLADFLHIFIGEELEFGQNFMTDSKTMALIRSELSDEDVTMEFARMWESNHPVQPKPNLMNRDEFNKLVERTGCGYRSTPEGEWK